MPTARGRAAYAAAVNACGPAADALAAGLAADQLTTARRVLACLRDRLEAERDRTTSPE